jgi:hypothetical protein
LVCFILSIIICDFDTLSTPYRLLLVAIILFIIGIIIKSDWFSNWWSKLTDKLVEFFMKKKVKDIPHTEISESDIINHDIFNYIDFWTYSKVPTLQFSSEYRTIVFKKYLTIFLKSYKRGLLEFVQSKEYQNMDQSELWKNLLELINKIVWNYEKECEESGIPKIVIMKMKAKNNDTITLTIDLIESISNSSFYESDKNFLKMYSIMNILLSILENAISNSESICNAINGQLKGLSITENGKIYTEPS